MTSTRAAFYAGWALFAVSVAAALGCLGVFFWYDTSFWFFYDVDDVLEAASAVLVGMSVSSGLLFFHYRGRESYATFEEIFFGVCFFLALLNLFWLLPVTLLG